MAPSPKTTQSIEDAFPFPTFWPHQREILEEAAISLFDDPRIDTVVIDAPTGIGKSPINVALARMADSAFYTTPQKKLRRQLEDDDDLRDYYTVVRARDDYRCPVGTATLEEGDDVSCEDCTVNQNPEDSCRHYNCPYWREKVDAMGADIATITFSYLVVDNNLETYSKVSEDGIEKTIQISFDDRDLLVIDEAHSLEEQIASLHAGFTVSPYSLPERVYMSILPQAEAIANRSEDYIRTTTVEDSLSTLYQNISDRYQELVSHNDLPDQQMEELDELQSTFWKIQNVIEEADEDNPWLISLEETQYDGDDVPKLSFQPVWVDNFLNNFVWSRADKVVLSTATLPFRGTPEKWLRRLGRDPNRTRIISKPMPFDAENRPVHTRSVIDRFSSKGDVDNWNRIVDTIDLISNQHAGEKGLVHTVSYERARKLHRAFESNAVQHENDHRSDSSYINRWQSGTEQMLLTPAMMEGVDLPDGECRWQVLLKVPYPNLSDARTHYLLNRAGDEQWYNSVTARKIIQSVGRGVRHQDDYCDYYVLDASWFDVMGEVEVPEWFEGAVVR